MVSVFGVLALIGFGFGLGRVHHISSLKAKIVKLESTFSTSEKAVVAKVKSLVKFF